MTKTIHTFFISTGRKNAMYTLRRVITPSDIKYSAATLLMLENHVCTLAADEERAIAKAREYVEAFRQRVGESESYQIIFDDCPDRENTKRRGKLSVKDTVSIEMIENDTFPFGKHQGKSISDAPESYLLFWADKSNSLSEDEPVMHALCSACLGVAFEKGYIAKRDAIREEQHKQDLKSKFIGKVGERQEFTGEIICSYEKKEYVAGYGYCGQGFFINKVLCGEDIVSYIGKSLGEKGDVICFKGTIKQHQEYKEVKTTVINRPTIQ